jgi:hypothetical protein
VAETETEFMRNPISVLKNHVLSPPDGSAGGVDEVLDKGSGMFGAGTTVGGDIVRARAAFGLSPAARDNLEGLPDRILVCANTRSEARALHDRIRDNIGYVISRATYQGSQTFLATTGRAVFLSTGSLGEPEGQQDKRSHVCRSRSFIDVLMFNRGD